MLTLSQVQETLPANHRNNITQEMVNQLNNLSDDVDESRTIRDNFVTFSGVLQEGRYKVGDYVRAVMYVSHKIMDKTNQEAYKATFPDRWARMIADGKEKNQISSIVTAYNKGALVTKIMERAMVPTWILNQDIFQKAIQTQHDIMIDPMVSDKVRVEAAHSLLTTLKRPEVKKAELTIDVGLNDGMAQMEKTLRLMSEKQLNMIEHDPNTSAHDIAAIPMKNVTPDDE